MTSPRRGRKREGQPELQLCELLWALEDDVVERRRAKSEPPMRCYRQAAPKFLEMHMEFNLESAFEQTASSSTEVTWSEQSNAAPSKKAKRNKRRKIREDGEKMEIIEESAKKIKPEITVIVDEEPASIYMTPPKSPDHEITSCTASDSKQLLLNSVKEYKSQGNNYDTVKLIGQLAQMAHCYNHKERPGEIDYDNMEELVHFYTEAPQIRDPVDAADVPLYFLPQKQYLMRREVRQRLYGAVSALRSQQTRSRPIVPDHLKDNPVFMSLIEEATALGRNCHTLAMLLEDLHSIPDL